MKTEFPFNFHDAPFQCSLIKGKLSVSGKLTIDLAPALVAANAEGTTSVQVGAIAVRTQSGATVSPSVSLNRKLSDTLTASVGASESRLFELAEQKIEELVLNPSHSSITTSPSARANILREISNIFTANVTASLCRGIISLRASTPSASMLAEGLFLSLNITIKGNQLVESFLEDFSLSEADLQGYAVRRGSDGRILVKPDLDLTVNAKLGFTLTALTNFLARFGVSASGNATRSAFTMSEAILAQLAIEVMVGVFAMPSETTALAARDVLISHFVMGYVDQTLATYRDLDNRITVMMGIGHFLQMYNRGVQKAMRDMELADISARHSRSAESMRTMLENAFHTTDRDALIARISYYLRTGSGDFENADILHGHFGRM